jgi:hypothetical protein
MAEMAPCSPRSRGSPQAGQYRRMRNHDWKIGPPPQFGHRNRSARPNSRAARRMEPFIH